MIPINKLSLLLTLVLLLVNTHMSYALMQDQPEDGSEKADVKDAELDDESEEPKTLEVMVDGMDRQAGIFTLYRDNDSGALHMVITQDQLNTEFLYFAFIQNGVLEAYQRRGYPIAQDVIEIRKYYDRIELVKKNTNYQIDPQSTLANGGMANITDAVLVNAKITATSEDGKRYLISADELFQTEALAQISYNMDPDTPPHEQFSLGSLAEDKVKYDHIGVYPENMNIRTDYVFQNPKPYVYGSERLADARATTITVQHSFVKMPDNDFVPRQDDQRVGYFRSQITDLNSLDFLPYRDLITRFHLVKKDPELPLSEPIEPIVWWIENTTPVEYREIMKTGVLAWNSAFEKAGFKNAIVVNIQADDATWNAEDVRYNVVRWSNTPDAGSAFGPSYINPRTGQILGGDVMMEHSFLSTYGFRGDVLANPSAFLNEYLDKKKPHNHNDMKKSFILCSKGYEMREMANFGYLALNAINAPVSDKRKIIEQMLMELMLHEVGHVLGLMHNMKASNLWSVEEALNGDVTQGITTASVMDYTALIVAKPGQIQGDFFTRKPGPYDDWAIQFGYDPAIEGDARDALLARSTEPQLMFGNDADDMRSPGSGIDPRVNVWDMSSDSIGFAQHQFELIDEVTPLLMTKLSEEGESWAKLRSAMGTMITYNGRSAATVANFIGGVEVSRFVQGQKSDSLPYVPVEKATQQRAMQILSEFILAPSAFGLPAELIAYSAMQRRGYEHYGGTEDPKLHTAILGVQKVVFSRLLNPVVMLRLSDTQLYGNAYTVEQMMNELSDAVFKADLKSTVNTRRQLLQHEYVTQLIGMLEGDEHDPIAKAATFAQLTRIQDWVSSKRGKDGATKVHRGYLAYLIKMALEIK